MYFVVSFIDQLDFRQEVCFTGLLEANDFVRQCICFGFNGINLRVEYEVVARKDGDVK